MATIEKEIEQLVKNVDMHLSMNNLETDKLIKALIVTDVIDMNNKQGLRNFKEYVDINFQLELAKDNGD